MIIVNNPQSYVNGNTVLKPDFEEYKEKHNKSKKDQNNKLREERLKFKLTVVRNILIAFTIGITILCRYGIIYNTQAGINTTNNEIKNLVAENDSLTIKLASLSNLSTLEKVSTDKLGMVSEDSNQIIYSDLTKNNFKIDKIILYDNKSGSSIKELIKKILF